MRLAWHFAYIHHLISYHCNCPKKVNGTYARSTLTKLLLSPPSTSYRSNNNQYKCVLSVIANTTKCVTKQRQLYAVYKSSSLLQRLYCCFRTSFLQNSDVGAWSYFNSSSDFYNFRQMKWHDSYVSTVVAENG